MKSSPCSPVIIIGMHRSGTSMVTRMLEEMGLFVGRKKESNHEGTLFLNLDRWLIAQCGGSWEYPAPVHDLIENSEARPLTTEYLAQLLRSPRAVSFLGWGKYLRYGDIANLDIPWGWKCPLTTYTLPLWLDLFPQAKVIHIYRHGIDVASSLRSRMRRELRRTWLQNLYYGMPSLYWLRPKVGGFLGSYRCATLEGGLSLWEEYFAEARKHLGCLRHRAMELKYEDFLAEPVAALKQLATFCNLPVSDSIEKVAKHMKKERAYAYRGNDELRTFASQVTHRLNAYNY